MTLHVPGRPQADRVNVSGLLSPETSGQYRRKPKKSGDPLTRPGTRRIVPGTGDPSIHSFLGDNQQSHRCTERQQRKKEEPGEPDRTLWCIPEPPDSPRRQCAEIPGHCNNQSSTDRYINIHNPSGSINRSSDVLSGNVARFVAGFYRVLSGRSGTRHKPDPNPVLPGDSAGKMGIEGKGAANTC